MFCKHKWKVVDKTVLPSAFEQDPENAVATILGDKMCSLFTYQKTVLVILTCDLCGKLRKFTETNP